MVVTLAVMSLVGVQGCTAIGFTLLGVGPGIRGGTGISYILVYQTFTTPVDTLQGATLKTLGRMDIAVKETQPTGSGRTIVAVAGDRTIVIELDRLTAQTSRMRVSARQGWFFRDRATAAEIIIQTAQTLDDKLRLARGSKPTTARPASKK